MLSAGQREGQAWAEHFGVQTEFIFKVIVFVYAVFHARDLTFTDGKGRKYLKSSPCWFPVAEGEAWPCRFTALCAGLLVYFISEREGGGGREKHWCASGARPAASCTPTPGIEPAAPHAP